MVICNLTATFDLSTFCRVFSDGGNFSTDEVDEYRKKLVREIFAVFAVQFRSFSNAVHNFAPCVEALT